MKKENKNIEKKKGQEGYIIFLKKLKRIKKKNDQN